MTPEDAKKHWEALVGAFMMNFGAIEALSCHWIYLLTKNQKARDEAIDLPLGLRIKRVCELVRASNLPEERKQRALETWGYVSKVSKMRNVIAHSPFITTKQEESGFINMRELKGVLDGSPVPVKPLTFETVAVAGRRMAKILKELLEMPCR